jgi:lipoprotein-anchoring transpeptidase ErfK/SrfK
MKPKIKSLSAKLGNVKSLKKPSVEMLRAKRWHIAIIGGSIVAFLALIGGATWFYHNRALPNVKLANITVSGKTHDQIAKIATQQANKLHIDFTYKGKTTTASAKDLGISVQPNQSADEALRARRFGGMWHSAAIWEDQNVGLATSTNFGTFQEYVTKHFPDIVVAAKDAQLTYNVDGKKFDIQPGANGQGFDARSLNALLPSLEANPRTVTLPVTAAAVKPTIEASTLIKLQTEVNQRVNLALKFTYKGQVRYTVEPEDIAKWVNFTPDPRTGKVTVTYDQAKVQQFLSQQVGPIIASPPIDQKVVNDSGGSNPIVLQHGQNGYTLQNIDGLTNDILGALGHNQALEKELTITETPYKTVTLTGYNKWIEVDLSRQRATLYVNTTAIASYTIASGTASHPTRPGTFHIWYKTPTQTMTGGNAASGDYYYLPNVTWVSYFDGEEAFHTAYWLAPGQFGHPQSHGCINMTSDAAKTVYDFAPIGTTVVVHY